MHFGIQEGTTKGFFYSGVPTENVDKDVLDFPAQTKCAGIRVMLTVTVPCSDAIFFLVTCFAGSLILTYLL